MQDGMAVWTALREQLPFDPVSSTINWRVRTFAKVWSRRRLGPAGIAELIRAHLPRPSAPCFLVVGGEDPVPATVADVIAQVRAEGSVWAFDPLGRWILELSGGEHPQFAFEFLDARNQAMIERLLGIEATWSHGGQPQKDPGPRFDFLREEP